MTHPQILPPSLSYWVFISVSPATRICTTPRAMCSVVSDSATLTPWAVPRQAPLSMGFSRQGYWRRVLFSTPGDLPDQGVEPESLASPALVSGDSSPPSHLGSPSLYLIGIKSFEMIKCPLPMLYTTNWLMHSTCVTLLFLEVQVGHKERAISWRSPEQRSWKADPPPQSGVFLSGGNNCSLLRWLKKKKSTFYWKEASHYF